MRIAYGVHGHGRGHAMRALAVLPELTRRHDVTVLAGGDAYHALYPEYPVVRIPTVCYHYDKQGRISNYLTAKRNLPPILDAKLQGSTFELVADILRESKPDIVLTDSEVYTHSVAHRLGLPRITFDHFGLLAYCRHEVASLDRLRLWGNSLVYRWLFGEPDRAIVSGFFHAPSTRPGVRVVGPVIREEVRQTPATRGEHLLVYLSKGHHEFTSQIEQALMSLDCPVRVYGTPRRGMQGNLQFKPVANLPFIEDLASCRAIFATAGNQLCGEVIHFGKPMLVMPIGCMEQRLNALHIERMGVGMQIRKGHVTADKVRHFLARETEFAQRAREEARDGAREAIEAIETFAPELLGRGGPSDVQASVT